jgi:hypothetical protein
MTPHARRTREPEQPACRDRIVDWAPRETRTTSDSAQQRNDYLRKLIPPDYPAEIDMLERSLRRRFLSPTGRANTKARIAFLKGHPHVD